MNKGGQEHDGVNHRDIRPEQVKHGNDLDPLNMSVIRLELLSGRGPKSHTRTYPRCMY